MMISPITFIEELKDADYNTLIEQRDQLIEYIEKFEKKEKAGDRIGDKWNYNPIIVYASINLKLTLYTNGHNQERGNSLLIS